MLNSSNPMSQDRRFGAQLGTGILTVAILVPATVAAADSRQLTRLSLEELASLKVVTVSGRQEASAEVAGAVYVVTSEEIQATGALTLPDAMRLAPGLQASRIDADEWALAIRGFASRLSRSVLVVMDGRSLWTPLFAGVFWGTQDTLLEDVAQIEVGRGPGGAVYGANALNGVISITTKSARDTPGALLTLGGGSADRAAGLRYGGARGDSLHYRVYAKHALRDGTRPTSAAGYDDEWEMNQGGFRLDRRRGERDAFTVSGDLYRGSAGQPTTVATFTPPFSARLEGDASFRGQNVVGRWTHTFAGGGEITTQAYYDHARRHEPHYTEDRDNVDLEVRHRLQWGSRHQAIWGLDYRRSPGSFQAVPSIQIVPGERVDDIAGLFANDEVRFAGGRLRLTLGTKLEWNDYSGWNVQPSGRIGWLAGPHWFWGSATRALRTSSRVERDVVLYTSLSAAQPLFAKVMGSPDFEPESVVALEAGYKLRTARVVARVSAFHNDYRDLASNEPGTPFLEEGTPPEPVRTVVPVRITNGPGGTASGVEALAIFWPHESWRVQASYSFLEQGLDGPAGSGFKANSPRHQVWVASSVSPRPDLELSVVFRAVGAIPGHQVPAYQDLDARVAFRPRAGLELAASGSNLLHARRPEFGGGFEVERAGRLQATLRF
jgi:iron complex outermembrane recepter protein